MKSRKPTAPSHVDLVRQADRECPALSWRERQAIRRLGFSRARRREPAGWDPLELRLGLRADLRQRRPYYAIWNPTYHELLRSHPALDDSLPGTGWLRTLYGGNRRHTVVLPSVRAALLARESAAEADWRASLKPAAPTPQHDLFMEAAC